MLCIYVKNMYTNIFTCVYSCQKKNSALNKKGGCK